MMEMCSLEECALLTHYSIFFLFFPPVREQNLKFKVGQGWQGQKNKKDPKISTSLVGH